MERLRYALCSRNILYKKILSESQFTYVYCCGMKDFLLGSLGDAVVANAIAHHITTLEHFLSSKACRLKCKCLSKVKYKVRAPGLQIRVLVFFLSFCRLIRPGEEASLMNLQKNGFCWSFENRKSPS